VATVARQCGKHVSHLYRLSRRFDWAVRAARWDLSQEQEEAAERRELRQAIARRQLAEVDRLRGLPLAGLAKWAKRDPVTGEWVLDPKVKPRDIVDLLKLLWETETKAAAAESASGGNGDADRESVSLRTSLSRSQLQELLAVAEERAQQEKEASVHGDHAKTGTRKKRRAV